MDIGQTRALLGRLQVSGREALSKFAPLDHSLCPLRRVRPENPAGSPQAHLRSQAPLFLSPPSPSRLPKQYNIFLQSHEITQTPRQWTALLTRAQQGSGRLRRLPVCPCSGMMPSSSPRPVPCRQRGSAHVCACSGSCPPWHCGDHDDGLAADRRDQHAGGAGRAVRPEHRADCGAFRHWRSAGAHGRGAAAGRLAHPQGRCQRGAADFSDDADRGRCRLLHVLHRSGGHFHSHHAAHRPQGPHSRRPTDDAPCPWRR